MESEDIEGGPFELLKAVVVRFGGHLPFLWSSSIFEVVFQKVKMSRKEGLPFLRSSSIFEVVFHF